MSKRKYTHVQSLLPEIKEMVEAGRTQREIAEYYGFKDKYVVKGLLKRERRRNEQAIPKQRGRKPAKTLAEYKYENKRLKMGYCGIFCNPQKGSEATGKVRCNSSSPGGIFCIHNV